MRWGGGRKFVSSFSFASSFLWRDGFLDKLPRYRRINIVGVSCLFRCFVFFCLFRRRGGYFRAEEMRVSRILACYTEPPPFSASPSGLNFPLRPPVTKYDFILDFCSSYRETFVSGVREGKGNCSFSVSAWEGASLLRNEWFFWDASKKGEK